MKILVLSFYFEPDLSAGSFRTTALVKELVQTVPNGSKIDVITTLPNRYSTFTVTAPASESREGFDIHRIALPSHQSGMVDQSKAFIVYFREVLRIVKTREYDLVYATSSKLMTAVLGALVARKKHAPLYLDIRDIFVDTIKDVLPAAMAGMIKPVFSVLERWSINQAAKVNLVSRGFAEYFSPRYPNQSFSYFTNGIDDEFLSAAPSVDKASNKKNELLTVVYAGNIGEGQGLHHILPALAKRMEGRLRFLVIGDGGRKVRLRDAIEEAGVNNIEMRSPVGREELITIYRGADILFLHLNDYAAFRKVLPSKLFEYAAMGKPIWAGIAGYSAEFTQTEISNSAVFHPCDPVGAEKVFSKLQLETQPRIEFIEKYARKNITKRFVQDILKTADVSEFTDKRTEFS